MKFTPSKLFHAVVISGAALAGCANTVSKPAARAPSNAAVNTQTDVGAQNAPSTNVESSKPPGTCPPGSERPYPPCYWIL